MFCCRQAFRRVKTMSALSIKADLEANMALVQLTLAKIERDWASKKISSWFVGKESRHPEFWTLRVMLNEDLYHE